MLMMSILAVMQSFAPYDVAERTTECAEQYFQGEEGLSISDLPGGLSPSQNLLIERKGERYVLRLQGLNVFQDDLDREFYAAEAAAVAGISPPILWEKPDHSAFLMDYISDTHLTIESAKKPTTIVKMAACLRKIHALPKNPINQKSHFEQLAGLYEILKPDYPGFERYMAEAEKLQKSLNESSIASTTLHGDLTPRNVFLGEKVHVIDWSETNEGNPLYDLAYFANAHNYDQKEEELLLKAYFGNLEHFDLYIKMKKLLLLSCSFALFNHAENFAAQQDVILDYAPSHRDWNWHAAHFESVHQTLSPQFFYNWGLSGLEYYLSLKS